MWKLATLPAAVMLALLANGQENFAREPRIGQERAPDAAGEAPPPSSPTPEQVREGLKRAIDFLLKDQHASGAWGSRRNAAVGFDDFWTNPETHRSWTVAVTGLCCMAMQEVEPTEEIQAACDRGVDYLVRTALVKRPNEWDTDNTWAYVYGLQGLARAYANPRYEGTERKNEIGRVAQALIDKLAQYQTPSGGWGYYDFEVYTIPPMWATSFMTAAAVLALLDARDAGLNVDARMLDRAVKAVRRCKLPSGAYTYTVEAVPDPRHSEWIDQVKGSLSRIQVCNLARLRAGEKIPVEELQTGIAQFFHHHRFLDVALKRPIPHEAYYLNSGYFYFFGHYYAALVIEQLPREERAKAWPKLQHHILKTQEKDGSMWDYYMNSYHKPYGSAYSIMALSRSLRDPESAVPAPGGGSAGPGPRP